MYNTQPKNPKTISIEVLKVIDACVDNEIKNKNEKKC